MEKTFFEMELRQALEKGQFLLHYQPQFDLKTGQIKGMEALARWNHPDRGYIPPLKFIPIAEENGFILPLGEWVLKTACAQAKAWQEQGFPPLRMSVNVSMRQFNHPSFVEDVQRILNETGLHPSFLNLEITESMMSDVKNCETVLQELHDSGIAVSVDDFGRILILPLFEQIPALPFEDRPGIHQGNRQKQHGNRQSDHRPCEELGVECHCGRRRNRRAR